MKLKLAGSALGFLGTVRRYDYLKELIRTESHTISQLAVNGVLYGACSPQSDDGWVAQESPTPRTGSGSPGNPDWPFHGVMASASACSEAYLLAARRLINWT